MYDRHRDRSEGRRGWAHRASDSSLLTSSPSFSSATPSPQATDHMRTLYEVPATSHPLSSRPPLSLRYGSSQRRSGAADTHTRDRGGDDSRDRGSSSHTHHDSRPLRESGGLIGGSWRARADTSSTASNRFHAVPRHADASVGAADALGTHRAREWHTTRRSNTPERQGHRQDSRRAVYRDDDSSFSYSYSYSYASRSSSSSSSAVSFIGSQFDALSLTQRRGTNTSGLAAAPKAPPRRVSFAVHGAVHAHSQGASATSSTAASSPPSSHEEVAHTAATTTAGAGKEETEKKRTADTTPAPASPIGGHGGSHVPTPAAAFAALLGRHGRKRNASPHASDDETSEKGDTARHNHTEHLVDEAATESAATRSHPSASTTPAHAPTPMGAAAAVSATNSRTASTMGAASRPNATVSNASRALAVYAQDNQSAAALLRAPPGSVVYALHTVNLVEEAQRRRSVKAMRENVDDAQQDELDDENQDQRLPYPSQLTHRVLPPPPPPPPPALTPGSRRASGPADGRPPAASADLGQPPAKRVAAGCCLTQARARRRQQKADLRDATRQAVNECLLRSHHVPLIPFETHRNQFDWMASGAPTFSEAAQSRWAYGLQSTAENPKALMGAMGDRSRPGRLSAKTTFAYGRRAGGGPQGGGRSEFLGPNDPVLYWASQLREQACLQLQPIDTTEVYSYTAFPTADDTKAEPHRTKAITLHSPPTTQREGNSGDGARRGTAHHGGRATGGGGDEDAGETSSSPSSWSDRRAVAAAMTLAAGASSTSPARAPSPRASPGPPLIALTAEGSTTVHATSPALLSPHSREISSAVIGSPRASELRQSCSHRTSLSVSEREGREFRVALTELSPPRSALARN